jgi:serine/threonine protein kinase
VTAPHLGPGHTIAGRYTVTALLGFTGEVATYQAMSPDGQEVVVKLYDPAIGQRADVMSQLERVHGLLAAMQQKIVVPVLDAGYESGSGAPFTVCDRLHIPSLARLVEQGPVSVEVVARVIEGMTEVLDAAHAVGLHHHALRPTNVFVGPAPDYAVRITDFGSAVVRTASPTHETYAQAAPWWAPEQMQPAAMLSAATDVFTTALIAFYALTGRSYWRSCQASTPDLAAWQIEIMGQRIPASQRARELGAFVAPAVDTVFERALSVNQSDRPTGARELANALRIAERYAGVSTAAKTVALPDMEFPSAVPPTVSFSAPVAASQSSQSASRASKSAPRAAERSDGYSVVGAPREAPAVATPQVTPGLPPFRRPSKKKDSSLVPVIIGVVSAVVLGGVGMVVLFTRTGTSEPNGAASSASAARSAAPVESSAIDDDEPVASATSTSVSSGQAGSASAPEEVQVTIKCVPACDRLFVDNREIEKLREAFPLSPGQHTFRVMKAGYVTQTDTVDIQPDKPFRKEYQLVKIDGRRPPTKDCGQFLKPCK